MKRIIFSNPPKDLFFKLKTLGLTDFHHALSPNLALKGKKTYDIKLDGISENATSGDFADIKLFKSNPGKYIDKYMKDGVFISATIDLSDKGIEILSNSDLTDWKIKA